MIPLQSVRKTRYLPGSGTVYEYGHEEGRRELMLLVLVEDEDDDDDDIEDPSMPSTAFMRSVSALTIWVQLSARCLMFFVSISCTETDDVNGWKMRWKRTQSQLSGHCGIWTAIGGGHWHWGWRRWWWSFEWNRMRCNQWVVVLILTMLILNEEEIYCGTRFTREYAL